MSERERVFEPGQTIAATKPEWTSDSSQPAKTPLNVPAMGAHVALQRKTSGQVAADAASVRAQERVGGPFGNGMRLQAKLTVGQAGDEYEQEADRIADQVMRMAEPTLQTKCACGETCEKCRDEAAHVLGSERFSRRPQGHGNTLVLRAATSIAYSSKEAKDVKDLWSTGSYKRTDTTGTMMTKAYHAWRMEANKVLDQLTKENNKASKTKLQEVRDWIQTFETHQTWSLRKEGSEPTNPGLMPADLRAPPSPAFRKITRYDVTIPGSVGSISYLDDPVQPRYRYLLNETGVAASGAKLKDRPDADQIFDAANITDATVRKVIKAVSSEEGGFEAVNTYDTGYVSIGMIQFTSGRAGSGSLTTLIREYKKASPADFNLYFHKLGIDVDDQGLAVVDPSTANVLSGEDAVKKIMDDKRLTAVFQRAGAKAQSFQVAQLRSAYLQYYMASKRFTVRDNGTKTEVTGVYGDVLTSEAGKVALMDRAVQRGTDNAANTFQHAALAVMQKYRTTTVADLAKYEREIIERVKNRIDVLSDSNLSQPPAQPQATPPPQPPTPTPSNEPPTQFYSPPAGESTNNGAGGASGGGPTNQNEPAKRYEGHTRGTSGAGY